MTVNRTLLGYRTGIGELVRVLTHLCIFRESAQPERCDLAKRCSRSEESERASVFGSIFFGCMAIEWGTCE